MPLAPGQKTEQVVWSRKRKSGAVQKVAKKRAAPLSEDCIPLQLQPFLHASELSSDSQVLSQKAGASVSLG